MAPNPTQDLINDQQEDQAAEKLLFQKSNPEISYQSKLHNAIKQVGGKQTDILPEICDEDENHDIHQTSPIHDPRPMTPITRLPNFQELYDRMQEKNTMQEDQTNTMYTTAPSPSLLNDDASPPYNGFLPMLSPRQLTRSNPLKIALVAPQQKSSIGTNNQTPYIKIIEQPASNGVRFRYNCEFGAHGNIPGANSRPAYKTAPSVGIFGYNGNAVLVISCVTKNKPYLTHPHNIIGKDTRDGVCRIKLRPNRMTANLEKIGIQCMKRKDFFASLSRREEMKVDPFNNGFDHKYDQDFDLDCVRFAIQAFIEGPEKGQYKIALPPVVSCPIFDKRSRRAANLRIYNLSHYSASANGEKEIIILSDRVSRDDILVRFFEEQNGEVIWEAFGDISRLNSIHKQIAITFQCPKYRMSSFDKPVTVNIQLMRPSDNTYSNSVPFEIIPVHDILDMKRKRVRLLETVMKNFKTAAGNISGLPNKMPKYDV